MFGAAASTSAFVVVCLKNAEATKLTDDLKKALADAVKAFSTQGPDAGVALTEKLLSQFPGHRDEILRERSYALLSAGRIADALEDRQAILDSGRGNLADHYFAGEYALQAGLFQRARDLFDQVIHMSQHSGSTYYLQSSRLLAALASYQLNEDNRCRDYLSLVEDDVEVLWLVGFDRVSKALLLEVLGER